MVLVGELLLERRSDGRLIDSEDKHLVIGQQVTSHGFVEAKPVELRPECVLVVHGRQPRISRCRFGFRRIAKHPRRRGHVDPLVCLDVDIVVHLDEVRIVSTRQGDPSGAVRLIGDHQTKVRHPCMLGSREHVDRLVGRKDR
ncbi:MAG: hypothetical protein QGF59_15925 [Pirellulaceae bacterium]|nr:hypothetical protein [Pirellulaceae bacterium]